MKSIVKNASSRSASVTTNVNSRRSNAMKGSRSSSTRFDFPNQPRFITGKHVLEIAGKDDGKNGVAILRGGGEEDIPVELDQKVDLRNERGPPIQNLSDEID